METSFGKARLLFLLLGATDSLSDDPQMLNSNQRTLKTVKHGTNIMIWGCISYYAVGPVYFIILFI